MRVSLDTNILHQEGYNSQSMRLLQRVIAAGALELVLSQIVIREYETKRLADFLSKHQSAKDSLREISKIFGRSGQEIPELVSLDSQLSEVLPELRARLDHAAKTWMEEFKVQVLEPHSCIYSKVWDDYFQGKGAFKKIKNRDDIPDAVIGLSLEKLLDDGMPLIFVCKDGNLKDYVKSFPKVLVFNDLPELVRSTEFESILSELDALDNIIEEFKKVIGSETFLANAMSYFSAKDSDFDYSYWEDGMIENHDELPLHAWRGVSVDGPVASSVKNVRFSTVSCVNARHYVVTVTFEAYFPVRFVGDYADWIHAPDDVKRRVEVLSANGDGACEFMTNKYATAVGEIVVHLLESLEPKSVLIHSKYIGSENSPLDVEFVPNKIIL
ncbi:PIN domain-containing protein [Pseudomonas sp. PS01301]|uniref:PIN domain-containing protein n=1 Tax=Pseudomonas sp. PS01301 TaxID=2991437 RepID=UPI00249B5FF5|nr:PIN domain-containing protein [Pseudomonas sp. PS01301]